MNQILRKTHVKENIDLLKARDVYFDIARKRNKLYEISIIIPPVVAGLTYVPFLVNLFPVIDSLRDYIIGITTILFVFINKYLEKKNEETLEVSNALREEYDLKVFDIQRNHFLFDQNLIKNEDGTWKKEIVDAWQSRPDSDKYEVWYTEFAGIHHRKNVLCNQMDNIIYTFHAYKEYKNKLKINVVAGILGIAGLLLASIFIWHHISVFILMMFSLFEAFDNQISQYKTIQELISINDYIYKKIKNDNEEIKKILDDDVKGDAFLRSLQDVIVNNRDKSLFIPKSIRNKFLKNGNSFYKQLDGIKQLYMEQPFIPQQAQDIDILSTKGETVTATIKEVHDHLRVMLKNVHEVLDKAGIRYVLDGGTLIGACRDKGFVFWDDDIDLAILNDDVQKAKAVLKEQLGELYDIQDYENEKFYSPRLSNFRIREKTTSSILVEKDSEMNEAYNYRGLFIDVYAYTPIVCNKTIDRFLRKLWFQGFRFKIFGKTYSKGLYDKIRKQEALWKYDIAGRLKHEKKFLMLKEKYLRRVNKYLRLAKNNKYMVYVPDYIDNLKKPGPYINAASLFAVDSAQNTINFEGIQAPVPQNYDEVLTAYYNNWRASPFTSLQKLTDENGKIEFSKKIFEVSILKHFKYIERFEN